MSKGQYIYNLYGTNVLLLLLLLFNLAVKQFVDSKVTDQQQIPSTDTTPAPIRVVIPFKDQVSANIVKKRLTDLSLKIKTAIQPVFIGQHLLTSVERPWDTL